MQTTLYIRTLIKYGRPLYYPACELSESIVDWLERKTFTERDLICLKRIGFSIVEHPKRGDKKNWME